MMLLSGLLSCSAISSSCLAPYFCATAGCGNSRNRNSLLQHQNASERAGCKSDSFISVKGLSKVVRPRIGDHPDTSSKSQAADRSPSDNAEIELPELGY